jgi:hypothetical protein
MFIGHFAVALAAKRAAPAVSLGTLFLACQLADLLWPILVLTGVEHFAIAPGITAVTPLDFQSYPYSHSLLMLVLWGVVVALIYKAMSRASGMTTMVVIAGVVISHWVLDVISHRPDMPISLGADTKVGFELWASKPATIVVELLMLGVALMLYARATRPKDRTGSWALYGLVIFLLVINVANMFGPPPPSVAAVAWSANAVWLIVAWGYWIDRHRSVRTELRRRS